MINQNLLLNLRKSRTLQTCFQKRQWAGEKGGFPAGRSVPCSEKPTRVCALRDPHDRHGRLDLRTSATQTRLMAHIYMAFDFGTDEEKAQQARHKLDGWKQAFRLDKKLLYKFERPRREADASEAAPAPQENKESPKAGKPAKGTKAQGSAKGKAQKEKQDKAELSAGPSGPIKLHVRLAFSGHEKMTEERWVKRIPGEEPFKDVAPETVKSSDSGFAQAEDRFEALEG
jgi:hypothetical protein